MELMISSTMYFKNLDFFLHNHKLYRNTSEFQTHKRFTRIPILSEYASLSHGVRLLKVVQITFSYTRRYEAEDFFALRAKQGVFRLFLLILRLCWCSVVTLVTFSGNLRNFKNNPKNLRIIQKKSKKKIREKKI